MLYIVLSWITKYSHRIYLKDTYNCKPDNNRNEFQAKLYFEKKIEEKLIKDAIINI